jgi:Ca-activated chloride channel homolog
MKTIQITLACILCAAVVQAQTERSLIRDGNRSYKDSKFTDAEVNYRKALEKNKDLTPGTFDLGDALYKQGRFGEAAEAYQSAAAKGDNSGLKSQALHNLGNALLKQQKLPESIASYKGALKLNPNDADTKYNLEYAKALLKRQQEQQQQQKQNKDQKKDQKKDDKQKQDQQNQDQQKQDQDKKDQEKQDQQKQDQRKQDQQKQDQQKQAQQKKQQISKEDAERILQALNNEEKNVQKKLHHKIPARVRVEKDW